MAITSGGGTTGVQITTAAKDSRLTESVLGSQAGANADQIIVPNAIGTNNEGNLETTPSYVGRLVMLRPDNANREVRYITADASNTLTVHEDWTIAPVSGDNWALSYIIQDAATVTGFSLLTKRIQDYAAGRRIRVGDGTNFAWFAMLDGVSLETNDNSSTTVADFIVLSPAYFHSGYTAGGVGVSGGYIIGTPAVNGELVFDSQSGSNVFLNDFFLTCVTQNQTWISGNVTINKAKIFSGAYTARLNGITDITDLTIEGKGQTTDTILIDASTTTNSLAIISTNGFITDNDATVQTITLNNVTFVNQLRYFLIYEKKTIDLVDPIGFSPITTDQTDLDFAGTNRDGELNEKYSLALTAQEADGTAISTPRVFFYEGTQTDSLVLDLTGNASGEVSSSWTYRNFVDNADTSVTTTTFGDHALRVFAYTYSPFVAAQTSNVKFDAPITLITDSEITETTQATAITAGSGIAPERHGTGETDPRAMKVLNYDGGTGGLPSVGETITSGSASGTLVEIFGSSDAVSGTIVIDTWNGTEFTDNTTITGGTSTFSATTDTAGFYEEYTWEIDCNNLALSVVYDYINAKMAEGTLDAIYDQLHEWGESEQALPLNRTGGLITTERNVAKTEGVWLSNAGTGTISYMTADDGTQFVPPTTVTFELTGLLSDTEVRIYRTSDGAELAGIENTSGTFTYQYVHTADVGAYAVIFRIGSKDIRLTGLTLSTADQSIPIQQQLDRVYST